MVNRVASERFPSARCLRQKAGRGEGRGGERGDYWRRRIGADRASAPSAAERLRCNDLSACERLSDFLKNHLHNSHNWEIYLQRRVLHI